MAPDTMNSRLMTLTYGLFVVATLSGIGLAFGYRPSEAHATTEAMRSGMPYLVSLHYTASMWTIFWGLITVSLMVLRGKFGGEDRATYLTTLVILLAAFLAQVTGNALPMDQHDVRTVVVEIGIASRVPLVGTQLSALMAGGEVYTAATTALWYGLHLFLVVALAAPFVVGRLTKNKAKFGFTRPEILVAGLMVGSSARWGFPSGSAAVASDFSSFDAQPSWYTLPLHGMLNAFEKISPGLGWVGAMIVPGLFFGFLFLLPKLGGSKPTNLWRGVFAGWLVVWVGVTLGFGGSPAAITGSQDEVVAQKTQTRAAAIDEALAARGASLFKSTGCAGCHGIDGTKGTGGPDLTTMHEKQTEASWYIEFIREPKKVKPSSTMPAFGHLSADELAGLAEYLRGPRKP